LSRGAFPAPPDRFQVQPQRKMQDMNAHTVRCFTAPHHGEPTQQVKPTEAELP
jgi:hypothetical protein